MKYYFCCSSCQARISLLLSEKIAVPDFLSFTDAPLLQSGQYCVINNFYISIQDKYNLQYHEDDTRRIGCCGPSLEGLPNLICTCKAEVGREVSDCLDPHFIIFYATKISLEIDDLGLLERILELPVYEQSELEALLRYDQTDDLLTKLTAYANKKH